MVFVDDDDDDVNIFKVTKDNETKTKQQKQQDVGENEEEKEEEVEIEEEFWPTALLAQHEIRSLYFHKKKRRKNYNKVYDDDDDDDDADKDDADASSNTIVLRYQSMSGDSMTPLDMTYATTNAPTNKENENENENDDDDDRYKYDNEYYDGTGHLVWMASLCFAHMIANDCIPQLHSLFVEASSSVRTPQPPYRICELGCGTGVAGLSLLLVHNHAQGNAHYCHVVFTDNDQESLALCQRNCELNFGNTNTTTTTDARRDTEQDHASDDSTNRSIKRMGIDPNTQYSQRIVRWGIEEEEEEERIRLGALASFETLEQQQQRKQSREQHYYSFDTVIATDVVYDLKMIVPLLQTVTKLLVCNKKPKHQEQHTDDSDGDGDTTSRSSSNNSRTTGDVNRNRNTNTNTGGYFILSHVPRFCIPNKSPEEDTTGSSSSSSSSTGTGDTAIENATINTNTNTNPNNTDANTTKTSSSYRKLEQLIEQEANTVGLVLIETLRPHEVLPSSLQLLSESNNTNTTNATNDDQHPSPTLETMKEAHAVIMIFQRM